MTTAICAHKGGAEHARPATYKAYRSALACGAEYAEFDVRRTRDGVLVVCHDARCPHDGPLVAELGYPELCDRLGYAVPRVDEVMGLLAGKVMGHLDLKETGYEDEVIRLALETFGGQDFIVSTLEDESVARIKQAFPGVRAALSLGRSLTDVLKYRWGAIRYRELFPLRRVRACRADWVAVNYKLARIGVLDQCRRHGIGTMVWTVDDDRMIDRFIADPRVGVLVTNRPGYAAGRRAALEGKLA
ncbi:MAG TPA: glycerophosphodiester phosphodiesterase [Streptosporangiaceae bacterium]|jgi:glycerophosphoryl diester phosphodiesterase